MTSGNIIAKASSVHEAVQTMGERIAEVLTSPSEGQTDELDGVVRLRVEIPRRDPLEWLAGIQSDEIVYWRNRDDKFEMAGVGVADCFESSPESSMAETLSMIESICSNSDNDVRYFGGGRFDPGGACAREWDDFGDYRFVLPRLELVRTPDSAYVACNLLPGQDVSDRESIVEAIRQLGEDPVEGTWEEPSVNSREDIPDSDRWTAIVQSALDAIERNVFKKIVLARKTLLRVSASIPVLSIMRKLRDRSQGCYGFYFQPRTGVSFMGATPERLYLRSGRQLKLEAVAGTRPRGNNFDEDEMLGKQLRESDKDVREHRLVVRSIEESLSGLDDSSSAVEGAPESLVKLEKVQHLITEMTASVGVDIADSDVLAALHPTAAVAGYPRDIAIGVINRLEGFDRGWYAGPVGWIANNESEFAVAIRSALVNETDLNLYAGAGIVKGSQAESEWEEIENKMAGMMKVVS